MDGGPQTYFHLCGDILHYPALHPYPVRPTPAPHPNPNLNQILTSTLKPSLQKHGPTLLVGGFLYLMCNKCKNTHTHTHMDVMGKTPLPERKGKEKKKKKAFMSLFLTTRCFSVFPSAHLTIYIFLFFKLNSAAFF